MRIYPPTFIVLTTSHLDLEDPVHVTRFFFFSQGAVWRRSSLSAREFNASAKTHGIAIGIGIGVSSVYRHNVSHLGAYPERGVASLSI